MSSEAPQVTVDPSGQAAVCPQCGVLLKQSDGGLVVAVTTTVVDTPVVWQRSRPDYPSPPGCRRIWLPFRGYLDVDDDIRKRVDRFFSVPMLTLALLVLPLLVVDYYISRGTDKEHWLTTVVLFSHVTISLAFAAEFVVKIWIAQSRFGYLGRNWIDLIIIILPFLRSIRVFQAFRMLRSLEAARVVQFSRIYAMRGVGLKAVRTMVPVLLGLRFTQRFRAGAPPGAPAKPNYARWPRAALVLEVERLRKELETFQKTEAPADHPAAQDAKP